MCVAATERRESAKRSRHAEDVRRGGNTLTPLVLETYGGMGPGAEAWFRGCIAVAELQRPEWLEEDEEMGMEWERWARAQAALRGLAEADLDHPPERERSCA